jgi:hypothetical protein
LEQLDGVLKETFILLNREVDLYRYLPGFLEFSFSILQWLRRVRVCVWVLWWGIPSPGHKKMTAEEKNDLMQNLAKLDMEDVNDDEYVPPSPTPV